MTKGSTYKSNRKLQKEQIKQSKNICSFSKYQGLAFLLRAIVKKWYVLENFVNEMAAVNF